VEPGLVGVQNALKRGIKYIVRATLEDIGALAGSMPAVGSFDVLEHIRDDAGFMASVSRFLVPDGRVYITVPAYNWPLVPRRCYRAALPSIHHQNTEWIPRKSTLQRRFCNIHLWFSPISNFLLPCASLPAWLWT
jgi:hypothetical protein